MVSREYGWWGFDDRAVNGREFPGCSLNSHGAVAATAIAAAGAAAAAAAVVVGHE